MVISIKPFIFVEIKSLKPMKKFLLKALTENVMVNAIINGEEKSVKLISYNADGRFYGSYPLGENSSFKKSYFEITDFVLPQDVILKKVLKKLYKNDLITNFDENVTNLDKGLIQVSLKLKVDGELSKMVKSAYVNYAINGENSEFYFDANNRFVRVSLGCFDGTDKGVKAFEKNLTKALKHLQTIYGSTMHVSLKNFLISE